MALDLNRCSKDCFSCIKKYKCKYSLEPGQKFEIECEGILNKKVIKDLLQDFSEEDQKTATTILDPVTWAAENLDWHCLDPDGEVWKRKNPSEYYKWIANNPGKDIYGYSRYHRPYQANMLRCSSQYKIFRIGRQAGKTEAIVVSMLFHLFTKPGLSEDDGFKIVVITPYLEQINLIFTRILELIKGSPNFKDSIARSVKAPNYGIELYNNSRIKGFTAGTKSGGNAASVRGQAANMLVFDEADYLCAADMDAALSIITNYPGAGVWMSSTPTGKREKFYKTCYMKDWKEFFFPSTINPLFDEKLDKVFKSQMTEIGYKHEVLAEFGEQEEGVFQNSYVQAGKEKYNYGDIPYKNNWSYSIGVDWNDTKNGTCIVVVGFNPSSNNFCIVDRATVSREGWTQLLACEKIAEYNRLWRPLAIYIDSGHGGTQWEVLRKFSYDSTVNPEKGVNHPDSRIKDILKKYVFGSNIETRDLWTKVPVKKNAKPFLVESTVRRFESQNIKFPASDELLEQQLLGYVVDRVSQSGAPIYKATDEVIGDHIIDALMLAIMGFVMEVSPLGKPKFESDIVFSGKMGEKMGPDIHEGDTVMHVDTKHQIKESKNKNRPNMDRWSSIADDTILSSQKALPASHTTGGSQVSVWDWPGFGSDAPKPKVRTLSEAEETARKRTGIRLRKIGRPRRKNI